MAAPIALTKPIEDLKSAIRSVSDIGKGIIPVHPEADENSAKSTRSAVPRPSIAWTA